MLTVPSASVLILYRKMLKRVGESKRPFLTPAVVLNQSPMPPLSLIVDQGALCHTQ